MCTLSLFLCSPHVVHPMYRLLTSSPHSPSPPSHFPPPTVCRPKLKPCPIKAYGIWEANSFMWARRFVCGQSLALPSSALWGKNPWGSHRCCGRQPRQSPLPHKRSLLPAAVHHNLHQTLSSRNTRLSRDRYQNPNPKLIHNLFASKLCKYQKSSSTPLASFSMAHLSRMFLLNLLFNFLSQGWNINPCVTFLDFLILLSVPVLWLVMLTVYNYIL